MSALVPDDRIKAPFKVGMHRDRTYVLSQCEHNIRSAGFQYGKSGKKQCFSAASGNPHQQMMEKGGWGKLLTSINQSLWGGRATIKSELWACSSMVEQWPFKPLVGSSSLPTLMFGLRRGMGKEQVLGTRQSGIRKIIGGCYNSRSASETERSCACQKHEVRED